MFNIIPPAYLMRYTYANSVGLNWLPGLIGSAPFGDCLCSQNLTMRLHACNDIGKSLITSNGVFFSPSCCVFNDYCLASTVVYLRMSDSPFHLSV